MADLIAMLSAAAGAVGGEYEIERSLRFNSADSAYLNRTPASAGNRKTFTWSGWVKRSAVGAGSAVLFTANTASGTTGYTAFFFQSGVDNLYFETIEAGGGKVWETTSLYRDASAWYHVVLAIDTSQATATNRVKMYVNGTQITAFSTQNTITLDFLTSVNDTVSHDIGAARNVGGTRIGYYNGYMTEINFIDGQALTPSSFGEINADTGVWSPIRYAGTYGTNGFYLNFSDNTSTTTLGDDLSGNGNDWTTNNFSVTAGAGNDSLVDSPTRYGTDTGAGGEVRGNYCTLNPLLISSTFVTVTNGNLSSGSIGGGATYGEIPTTFAVNFGGSNKWYAELNVTTVASTYYPSFGIAPATKNFIGSDIQGGDAGGGTAYMASGEKYNGASLTAYGASYTGGDVIGIAIDESAGTVVMYKNNVSQGTLASSLTGLHFITVTPAASSAFSINFGQRPFAYTAPSGFKALCTTNLPDPTIVESYEYFNTVLYTGTGSSLGVTGVGFQPDWVWIKERNGAADHGLYDAVRGVQEQLESNTTTAETTEATGLTAFGTDGFTVGALAQLNTSADTYVAWNWKANGAGSSNTDGTISSTVSVSTTSGFSIVTYTGNAISGATVGHGLGAVPAFVIFKDRGAVTDWRVWQTSFGTGNALSLNSTTGTGSNSAVMQATPTSTLMFLLGSGFSVNNSGNTYVAYCFAPVAGYSAFGSFVGNGSADGPFAFLGFRPAFVMLKRTDSTSNWTILDFKREGYNVDNDELFANLSNAEGTTDLADLLSNGFKLRSTDASVNASGGTYIFACFATSPFKLSLAR